MTWCGRRRHHATRRWARCIFNLNRNKRVIALDLKSPKAMDVMRRLIAGADVLAHNMRPDALKRAGLGYDVCKAINPKLIHAGIIGFGRGGRYRDRPGV